MYHEKLKTKEEINYIQIPIFDKTEIQRHLLVSKQIT
jgi:hypothetical protein